MSDVFDATLMRIFNVIEAGIGRNIGSHEGGLTAMLGTPLEWAKNRRDAESQQETPAFENWLMDLRPEPGLNKPLPIDQVNRQNAILSDIATQVKEAIEVDLNRVEVHDFDMEPQGFSPPLVISTFEWVAMALAQHAVMKADFGWPEGQVEDFMRVYEIGHLPVGCLERPHERILLVW